MPDVRRLQRPKPTSLTVDLGEGETLNLVYDKNAITPATLELGLARGLPVVIVEWDLTDDGEPFPPVEENVAQLSYTIQHALMDAIVSDATPSDAEGNGSSASAPAQSSASEQTPPSSPNGSDSSTSPQPLAVQSTS